MKFKMNKKIARVMAVLILTMSIGSAVFAASCAGYHEVFARSITRNGWGAWPSMHWFATPAYKPDCD